MHINDHISVHAFSFRRLLFNFRYQALDLVTDGFETRALLLVHDSVPEDLLTYFYLEVRNDVGRNEYPVAIDVRPTTTEEPREASC